MIWLFKHIIFSLNSSCILFGFILWSTKYDYSRFIMCYEQVKSQLLGLKCVYYHQYLQIFVLKLN